ncbi:MAG: endonuclease/exonuclease/phosphatase family protein [Spirochaetales bacterium]|nr:endonuclease/exonuclease/phosphatase family protein [Spirochaetales bacterium]
MKKNIILFFILFCSCACSKDLFEFSVMSYNLYNIFDDKVQGGEYSQYNPSNSQIWNSELYHRRIKLFSEVILDTYSGGADILVFQEVENVNVIKDLLNYYLRGYGYHYYSILESEDSTIANAIISKIRIKSVASYSVAIEEFSGLRDISAVDFDSPISFRLFVNHWKSRLGGADYTYSARQAQSRVLASAIAESLVDVKHCIALGDFNEPVYLMNGGEYALPSEYQAFDYCGTFFEEISSVELPEIGEDYEDGAGLAWAEEDDLGKLIITADRDCHCLEDGAGVMYFDREQGCSYYYQESWLAFDAVFVSQAFVDSVGWELESVRVIRSDKLLNSLGLPLRWSSKYSSGYSDHLPVLAIFKLN